MGQIETIAIFPNDISNENAHHMIHTMDTPYKSRLRVLPFVSALPPRAHRRAPFPTLRSGC